MVDVEATVIEISDNDVGLRAFARWAEPRDAVRVLFGPDVIMAIETPLRRGWIMEEIYFATAWIDRGVDDFLRLLQDDRHEVQTGRVELDPQGMLEMILRKGSPVDEVKHLF